MRPAHIATAAAVLGLAVAGCRTQEAPAPPDREAAPPAAEVDPPAGVDPPLLRRATCPAGLAGCRAAGGRIVFVERVDPDGDGDAHFVLASRDSVSAPGITIVDVRRDLRPRPLPAPGDWLSAAGPVFTGSYGQRQIEAVEVFTTPR